MTLPAAEARPSGPLRHIPELDGMRGIAALAVYFHHVCYSTVRDYLPVEQQSHSIRFLYSLFAYGNSGVDLFFVLSGFLITSVLIEARGSDRYYRDFYWKRVLRILPLYLLCLIVVAITLHQMGYALLSLVFLANFAAPLHVVGYGPFWTLAIEEQFYLVWPTVVKRCNTTLLLGGAVGIGIASVLLRFLFAFKSHYNYQLTPLVADSLAFGAGLACLRRSGTLRGVHALWGLWIAVLSGLALEVLILPNAVLTVPVAAATHKTAVTLLAGGVIGLCIARSGSQWLAIFRSRFLRFFGLISYAFYMVHLYVLLAWDKYIWRDSIASGQVGDTSGYWERLVACLVASIGIAVVTRYMIELPALNLRRYVLSPTGKREVAQHS
ncbi:acyltransferase family protein [Terriglobus roseus]|uniref:Peptidoglycan/LPS O-acetylase OafA/YrhL, contains acyltransferase and SGNH-hydrolase domains n=1 Tax=Terriglobus roseus TaxID=392734 RepID=A0A1H4QB88_9BACT|nr:acyltransferase [Terriglobus roseus]SEC16780.1 Peptidoglycan/LPS O-acetylase OafA/YrhL, contains acyltransferase and SGNH-hydrolase domains [Terriglobus roseus]